VGSGTGVDRATDLQEADVLLLDEPTNDLDIPTLEILEESCWSLQGRCCW